MEQQPYKDLGISVAPLAPALGVRVDGIDLTQDLHADVADALRALYLKHHLIYIEVPDLSDEAQARFATLFGTTSLRERNKQAIESNDNQYVSNIRPDGIFGKGELDFHIDQLFLEEPLKAIILYGVEVPEAGGATKFVNAEAAYDAMPNPLKQKIDGLRCVHARAYDTKTTDDWNVIESAQDSPHWTHPMLHRDERTGKRALWVNKLTTLGVADMAPDESATLLEEVRAFLYDPALGYCHNWAPGDLILWNNFTLQHARTPFPASAHRTLRRTAIL